MKVLIVEDSATQAAEISFTLEDSGHEVVHAEDGEAAVELLGGQQFDLIVSDVLMPRMSGFQLVQHVRNDSKCSGIPVILLTTLDESADVIRGLVSGADAFLCKPFDPENLVQTIASFENTTHSSHPAVSRFPEGETLVLPRARTLRYLNTAFDSVLAARMTADERARHSHEALRRSEERFALSVAGANDILWDWDVPTGRVYFSPRFDEVTGFLPSERPTSYWEWSECIHDDDRERFDIEIAAHLSGVLPHIYNQHRFRTASGAYRWVLLRGESVRDAEGRGYRVAGSLTDIHEMREMERRLLDSSGDLRSMLSAFPDLYVRLDASGRIEDFHAGTEWTGDSHLPAKTSILIEDWLPAEAAQGWRSALAGKATGEKLAPIEHVLSPTECKSFVRVAFTSQPNGGCIAVLRDLTASRQRDLHLHHAEARASLEWQVAPMGSFRLARDGRIVDCNDALCHLLGQPRSSVLQAHYREFLDPDDSGGVEPLLQAGQAAVSRRISVTVVGATTDSPFRATVHLVIFGVLESEGEAIAIGYVVPEDAAHHPLVT